MELALCTRQPTLSGFSVTYGQTVHSVPSSELWQLLARNLPGYVQSCLPPTVVSPGSLPQWIWG